MVPLKNEHRAASIAADAVNAQPETGTPDGELAGALHEVSNALTVVLGWLQHAQEQLPQGPAAEAVEVARKHAALGHGIARRAVGASQTESSELLSARSVAEQLVLSVSPEATRRGVRVEISEDSANALIAHGDAVQQIVLNLLLNALAFTPHGREIRFSLRNEDTFIVFRIEDDGPGVPANVRQGLFVRSNSMRPGGAGIGLSHSHKLAERWGGNLALLHRAQGGACFDLHWPATEAPSSSTLPSSTVPCAPARQQSNSTTPVQVGALAGLQVAVLEDDADVMGMLELGLSSRGVTLYPLANKEALFEFADNGPSVDAILIDLSPIASDPEGAIRRLRARSPRAAVYLISGTVLSTDAGPDIAGWIRKPFELGEIYEALSKVRSSS